MFIRQKINMLTDTGTDKYTIRVDQFRCIHDASSQHFLLAIGFQSGNFFLFLIYIIVRAVAVINNSQLEKI